MKKIGRKKNEKGFSLVEIIVVLVVISILGYIVYDVGFQNLTTDAKKTVVVDFFSKKAAKSIWGCASSESSLTSCDKEELTTRGLPNTTPVGAWDSVATAYSIAITVGFTEVSDPSKTIHEVIAELAKLNVGDADSSPTIVLPASLTIVYRVK